MELMRIGKDERLRGTVAQELLDRGAGASLRLEVVTDEKQDYIAALKAVSERLRQAREQGQFLVPRPPNNASTVSHCY